MSWQASEYVTKHSRQTGSALAILLIVATHAHADGTGAHMSIATLMSEGHLSESQVRRTLRRLEASGELERAALPHGSGTNIYTVVGVGVQQVPLLGAEVVDLVTKAERPMTPGRIHAPRPGASMRVGGRTDDPLTVKGTVTEPSRASRARARGPEIPTRVATRSEVAREQKLFARAAREAWLASARKCGSPYTDSVALRIAEQQAVESLRWATEAQILAAIPRRMDHESTPRRIPEWARLQAADDSERDHQDRKRAERLEEDAVWASQTPEQRAHDYRCATCDHWPHRDAACACCASRAYIPRTLQPIQRRGLHRLVPPPLKDAAS
jgi:hypothetical protein